MDYGIIVTAVSLFGTLALALADATMEPELPAASVESTNEGEQEFRQAA
jgi:hypothetical protein